MNRRAEENCHDFLAMCNCLLRRYAFCAVAVAVEKKERKNFIEMSKRAFFSLPHFICKANSFHLNNQC